MKFPEWLLVYGDQSFRDECPIESDEQKECLNFLQDGYPRHYRATITPRLEGGNAKKHRGRKGGQSDIIILGKTTFVCELKRKNHMDSEWKPGQEEFLKDCMENGAFVCVALGHEAFEVAFKDYLNKYS